MAETKQNADGSMSTVRERDGVEASREGGYAGPGTQNIQANGPAVPAFMPGSTLEFNVNGANATTGGGTILSWLNNLPYDIVVNWAMMDVIGTGSSTATVSFGQATTATGTSSNILATQSTSAVATLGSGSIAVKVKQNQFITGAAAVTGATFTAYFGKVAFSYIPVPLSTTQDSI